ncbi:nitrate- and nitrite sensing domain-containing protein [Diaphorobacter ruginosibacter]|uniref:Nitrate- and nitrite sensing domain-containing protein n=1 Tax=Diaphorobacter ruginosibacter TaxID=1715720 RepID=A0A7G9RMM6_9BURK|nr:nitrate regulatory protein [Diaphorobacter ruginosibacter]QNN56851.1 nitrate- and nitrite sensing domain-containing protein [Diaphorobacter ruginosibacter]
MKSPLCYLVAARQSEIAELEQLRSACSLVTCVSELIHELQKERGLSNLWLASGGQQGAPALAAQMRAVDDAIGMVRLALDAQELPVQPARHAALLYNAIACLLQGLASLPALRSGIGSLALTLQESTAAFVRLIAACLALVFEAADSACDPDVSRLLVALFHFMQGKELAGQERATGAAAFASGVNDEQRRRHWLHLIDSQEQCFQVFTEFAPAAMHELWLGRCEQGPDMSAIERLRRVACTAQADDGLDAGLGERWFAACSLRLDAMHEVEVLMARELALLCAGRLELAQTALQALQDREHATEETEGLAFFAVDAPDSLPRTTAAYASCAAFGPQLERSIRSLVQEQSQRLLAMQAEIDRARTALVERKTIERAKGMLMHLRQISESDAHKLLRQTAMNQNRRLLDVAQAVLSTVELLPP